MKKQIEMIDLKTLQEIEVRDSVGKWVTSNLWTKGSIIRVERIKEGYVVGPGLILNIDKFRSDLRWILHSKPEFKLYIVPEQFIKLVLEESEVQHDIELKNWVQRTNTFEIWN
jgi:hypothetical protein